MMKAIFSRFNFALRQITRASHFNSDHVTTITILVNVSRLRFLMGFSHLWSFLLQNQSIIVGFSITLVRFLISRKSWMLRFPGSPQKTSMAVMSTWNPIHRQMKIRKRNKMKVKITHYPTQSLRAHINLHTSSLLILCMVVTTTTKRNNARVFKFNEKWKDGCPWLK